MLKEFSKFWLGFFSSLRIETDRIFPLSKSELRALSATGILTPKEHGAYLLGCALTSFAAFIIIFSACILAFSLNPLFLAFSLALPPLSIFLAMKHFKLIVSEKEKEVEANLLDALRHFATEVKNRRGVQQALISVGRGGYSGVSGLFKEAFFYMRDGASIDTAFSKISEKTTSQTFHRFAASLSYAMRSGIGIEGVLESCIREIESSQRSKATVYSNECLKTSTFLIVLTGVLPGILLFAVVQSGFVFSAKFPPEIVFALYVLGFPTLKYYIQMGLAGKMVG